MTKLTAIAIAYLIDAIANKLIEQINFTLTSQHPLKAFDPMTPFNKN